MNINFRAKIQIQSRYGRYGFYATVPYLSLAVISELILIVTLFSFLYVQPRKNFLLVVHKP